MVSKLLDTRSMFGVNCARCDNELIAPEKSEYLDDAIVRPSLALPEMPYSF